MGDPVQQNLSYDGANRVTKVSTSGSGSPIADSTVSYDPSTRSAPILATIPRAG